MILKTDCRYYPGDRPCKFSKAEGFFCDNCTYYNPVKFKIIIIKLDAVGDVLRTTSIIPALKRQYPESFITWVTKQNAVPVLKNISGIDEILIYEDISTISFLQNVQYNILLNPDASPKSAALASMVDAEKCFGYYLGEQGKVLPFSQLSEEWLELGSFDELKKKNSKTYQQIIHEIAGLEYQKDPIQLVLTEDEKSFAGKFSLENNLSKFKSIIGLNTGASGRWELKQWTMNGYRDLIKQLSENKEVGILLYGGPEERQRNSSLAQEFPFVINTGNDNSLREFFALLSLSDIIVTGDTMSLHASAALGKQIICLFGPTSSAEIEDYGIIQKIIPDLDCLVCYKPECDFNPNCMQSITVDMVLSAVNKAQNLIRGKNE